MPSVNDLIGPIADIYVGDVGAVDVLTLLPAPRTQGGRFRYSQPQQWESVDSEARQSGECEVTVDLTFYWNEDAHKIAMTNPLSAANIDDAPGNQHYVVLLLAPDENIADSILLPECVARCQEEESLTKTDFTTIQIQFYFRNRNKFQQIYRKGTYATLASILGVRSPI